MTIIIYSLSYSGGIIDIDCIVMRPDPKSRSYFYRLTRIGENGDGSFEVKFGVKSWGEITCHFPSFIYPKITGSTYF